MAKPWIDCRCARENPPMTAAEATTRVGLILPKKRWKYTLEDGRISAAEQIAVRDKMA
jgi:hypothetical protein